MALVSMLTTTDNPWDPFDNFKEWYAWDEGHGYHTSGLLARLTFSSYELSVNEQAAAIEAAMDEIVENNYSGVHRKITKEIDDDD